MADREFIATSLITGDNLNMNDVEVNRMSYEEIQQLVKNFERKKIIWKWITSIIDPRALLKEARSYAEVETLVSDSDIIDLANGALKLHLTYV